MEKQLKPGDEVRVKNFGVHSGSRGRVTRNYVPGRSSRVPVVLYDGTILPSVGHDRVELVEPATPTDRG
jgi:hypothetical protein